MILVDPRPNTIAEVATYADWERKLLNVRPGITNFSSIVFSDEGDILKDSVDPDGDYTRLIRPWKGQLGLLYTQNASLTLNMRLIWLTLLGIVNKHSSLTSMQQLLVRYGAKDNVLKIARRDAPLDGYIAQN